MRSRCRAAAALSVLAALPACAAGAAAAPTDRYGVKVTPDGPASGTVRVTWSDDLQASIPRSIRSDGAVTYTVEDRLRSGGELSTWVTDPLPDFVTAFVRRAYGDFLRARVAVDRYASTAEYACDNGAVVRTTTAVTGVTQPHAVLETGQERLDLPRRRGTGDVELAFAQQRDGVFVLRQGYFGAGTVSTRTTGEDCSGYDDEGRSAPAPVDRSAELSIVELMGSDVAEGIQTIQDIPLQVGADGASIMQREERMSFRERPQEAQAGTVSLDLRFGGSPHARRASCVIPSYREMAGVRSLRAAQRAVRRHGLRGAVFGGSKPDTSPRGSYFLKWGSDTWLCGATMGTRRFPALYRSLGIVQG